MDGRSLRYFVEVVRQGGFTRAAEVLNVTQPAISKMIRQLEENLGAPLLIRRVRSIELTEAGRLAYLRGVKILEGMSSLRADVEALKGKLWGKLCLGIPPLVGAAFFPRVLRTFNQLHPEVTVTVAEFGGKKIREMVLSGHVDVGVTLMPYDTFLFDGLTFAEEELSLVVPQTRKWREESCINLGDLADERFVMPTEDYLSSDRFREACRVHGFVPREVGHSGQWDFLAAMVEAGIGITFIPKAGEPLIRPHRVRILPIRPAIGWQLALIWRRGGGRASSAINAWVDVTRSVLLDAV
jgi:DNA-binding transcriptional LysR family regulator